jgi:hypothetical protein
LTHPIEPSTFRILSKTGSTIGTGFLVAPNLGLTCAHVIDAAFPDAEHKLQIRFAGRREYIDARALVDRVNREKDVAILEIDTVPEGVHPLRMGCAGESRLDKKLYTYGYAIAAGEQGLGGLGTFITHKPETGLIQFRMHEADHGHSGAPVFDDKRGVVIGMVKKGKDQPGRNDETTFAISTETIWQVYPELKPPTPILPRRNPIVEGINLLPYDYDQRIQNFLTEYLGTEAHPVPFGGRDDALKMLDNWLADTTPYLLLAAPAGRGKSALLVRWLDNLLAREDLALAFVPVSIRFGTNMERVFYAALAARLAFLHGDDIPASPETSTAVYRGLVADYLSKSLANGRMLLVVLDGLDEAADWQAGADFMPGELPAGVRVVVSARFLAGDVDSNSWLRRLNWERNGLASAPSLTPLDQDGVRDVLFKMGCPLDELSRQVDIVVELHRLSAGDPLLVSLYVSDLWVKGEEVTRLKPKDLVGIEPGYKGYFDRWWDDQKKLWGKDKPWLEQHVWTVLNLLAGALGPLFKDDMQMLAPELDSNYIADALEILQRLIIGGNQLQGYTFSHSKLGQYFWDTLTSPEQAQVERRFLTWGERILQEFIDKKRDPRKKTEVPIYAVRNYGMHLARSNQHIEKWLPLIHHQQWAQAWFTVEGAYGGYLQDIKKVKKKCEQFDFQSIEINGRAPNIGNQVRCALIESSLQDLSNNIHPELIWLLLQDHIWTWSQALVIIRKMSNLLQMDAISNLIPHLDIYQLTDLLEVITSKRPIVKRPIMPSNLSLEKLVKYSSKNLEELKEEMFGDKRRQVYRDIVYKFIELLLLIGESSDTLITDISNLANEYTRFSMLYALAKQVPSNSLKQLLGAVQELKEEYKADLLSILAQRVPDDQLTRVLELARSIENKSHFTKVLLSLTQRLPDLAGETFASIMANGDKNWRINALNLSIDGFKPTKVQRILESEWVCNKKNPPIEALLIVTQSLPEVYIQGTLKYIANTGDSQYGTKLLNTLMQHLPQDYLGRMLEFAHSIRIDWYRDAVVNGLVLRLSEIENISPRATNQIYQRTLEYVDMACSIILAMNTNIKRVNLLFSLSYWRPELRKIAIDRLAQIKITFEDIDGFISAAIYRPDLIKDILLYLKRHKPTYMHDEQKYIDAISKLLEQLELSEIELQETEFLIKKITNTQSRIALLVKCKHSHPKSLVEILRDENLIGKFSNWKNLVFLLLNEALNGVITIFSRDPQKYKLLVDTLLHFVYFSRNLFAEMIIIIKGKITLSNFLSKFAWGILYLLVSPLILVTYLAFALFDTRARFEKISTEKDIYTALSHTKERPELWDHIFDSLSKIDNPKIYSRVKKRVKISALEKPTDILDAIIRCQSKEIGNNWKYTNIFRDFLIILSETITPSQIERVIDIANKFKNSGTRLDVFIAYSSIIPYELISSEVTTFWNTQQYMLGPELPKLLTDLAIRQPEYWQLTCSFHLWFQTFFASDFDSDNIDYRIETTNIYRRKAWMDFAKNIPKDLVLFTIKKIHYDFPSLMGSLLSSLINKNIPVHPYQRYQNALEILSYASENERSSGFLAIDVLLPYLAAIGPNNLYSTVAKAVRDVTTWWP